MKHIHTETFFDPNAYEVSKKVNIFLAHVHPEDFIDIKYAATEKGFSALLIYKK